MHVYVLFITCLAQTARSHGINSSMDLIDSRPRVGPSARQGPSDMHAPLRWLKLKGTGHRLKKVVRRQIFGRPPTAASSSHERKLKGSRQDGQDCARVVPTAKKRFSRLQKWTANLKESNSSVVRSVLRTRQFSKATAKCRFYIPDVSAMLLRVTT